MHNLIGSWKLIDWTVEMQGDRVIKPFRGRATGVLTYTDEDRMVASLMKTDREPIGIIEDMPHAPNWWARFTMERPHCRCPRAVQ